MKELLSFLKSKTQALVGQKFVVPKCPNKDSLIAFNGLDLLWDAFHAVGDDNMDAIVASLDGMKVTERVVVCEGSFYGAIFQDISRPLEVSRTAQLAEMAPQHIGGLGLGLGHAFSNMKLAPDITPELSESYVGWLAMDAYGMHEGYFRWFDSIQKMREPVELPAIAREAFDQGLGRAIYFISGGHAQTIVDLVNRFPLARRFSLWRGIGLMTGFWGIDDEAQIKRLLKLSGVGRPHFQQGITWAVSMRYDMNEVEDFTKAAAETGCGASVLEIASLAQELMQKVPGHPAESRTLFNWQNQLVDFFSGSSDLKLLGADES